MTKLSSVVVRVDDVHQRNMRTLIDAVKQSRQPALYSGRVRTYEPFTAGEEHELPEERTEVQVSAHEGLHRVFDLYREMWDIAAQRDATNCIAKAHVLVDGEVLISDAPVPLMLYLIKHLTELRSLVESLPVRDPAERWTFDETAGLWHTAPIFSLRTSKEPRVVKLADATDRHPEQTHLLFQDVPIGKFKTIKLSGALSTTEKQARIARITTVLDALKDARSRANETVAVDYAPAAAVVAYLQQAG